MATGLYLKKQLATNVPLTLRMVKRGGSYPETDFTTKEPTGKNTYLYIFEDQKGQELKHYAKEREEETLSIYEPGQEVTVVLQETMKNINGIDKRISFLVWGTPGSAELHAAPQLKSNTAVVRQEKNQEAYQAEQKEKDVRISLQGLMQAHICAGKTNADAIKFAIEGREMLLITAAEIAYLPQA